MEARRQDQLGPEDLEELEDLVGQAERPGLEELQRPESELEETAELVDRPDPEELEEPEALASRSGW